MPARVRWGNVGRAAGVAGAVALVVAWPRLGGPPVALPGGEAVPVVGGERRVAPSGSAGRHEGVRRVAPSVKGRDEGVRRVAPSVSGRRRGRTAPVKGRDEGVRRKVEPRPGRQRAAPVSEGDEPPGATTEPPAPDPPPAPSPPPPPPAPTIDPAEREFGFER
jgi:hypothetical protein